MRDIIRKPSFPTRLRAGQSQLSSASPANRAPAPRSRFCSAGRRWRAEIASFVVAPPPFRRLWFALRPCL